MIFQETEWNPKPYAPPTWAGGTDEEIVEALEKHYAGEIDLTDYWSVGDERAVNLSAMAAVGVGESQSAQTATLLLVNVGGKTLQTAINGHAECAFIWQLKNCLLSTGYIDSTGFNTVSWRGCTRRTWCNDTFFNALPSYLQNITKSVSNLTNSGGGSSTMIETFDKIALPALVEAGISASYAHFAGEGSAWSYYDSATKRIKLLGDSGAAQSWWLRSPNRTGTTQFRYIDKNGGGSSSTASNLTTHGFAPFGCI